MTDLFEKSIATLELPKVLEQLAACAVTQEGKERALALRGEINQALEADFSAVLLDLAGR